MATVIEMVLRLRPSDWLVRLLSIEGHVGLAVNQELIQDRFSARGNFLAMSGLHEVTGILKSIEKNYERSAPSLASSSALHFRRMLQCPRTQISVTLNRPERRWRQRRHSVMNLTFFATFDRDFIAALISEKIEMRVR